MSQVLRSLGLMTDLDIDEMESLAQRVEMAKHQVLCPAMFCSCAFMQSLPSERAPSMPALLNGLQCS